MVALLDVVERGAEPDRVGDAGRTGLESRWALGKADGKLEPRVKDREDARAWRCRFSGIRCPVASHAILIGGVEAPVLARDVHAVPVHRARVTTIRVSFGRERQRAARTPRAAARVLSVDTRPPGTRDRARRRRPQARRAVLVPLDRGEPDAHQQPSLTAKKLRRLEITACAQKHSKNAAGTGTSTSRCAKPSPNWPARSKPRTCDWSAAGKPQLWAL